MKTKAVNACRNIITEKDTEKLKRIFSKKFAQAVNEAEKLKLDREMQAQDER